MLSPGDRIWVENQYQRSWRAVRYATIHLIGIPYLKARHSNSFSVFLPRYRACRHISETIELVSFSIFNLGDSRG